MNPAVRRLLLLNGLLLQLLYKTTSPELYVANARFGRRNLSRQQSLFFWARASHDVLPVRMLDCTP